MARYFGQNIADEGHPPTPSTEALIGLQPMERARAEAVMRAQDKVVTQSRRILLHTGVNGDDAWLVPNTAPGATQTHPEVNVPRSITIGKWDITPGCTLKATCLHVPSGQTSYEYVPPNWREGGVQGVVQLVTTWYASDASTETYTYVLPLKGSQLANGSENTNAAGMQKSLRLASCIMVPPVNLGSLANRAKWSRPYSVEVEVRYVGSPRVVDLTISETPAFMVREADDADDEWLSHVFAGPTPDGAGPVVAYPVDEHEDTSGADADQRHGSLQCLRVAANQRRRLGPMLFHWSAYAESEVTVDQTALELINIPTAASARWCNLLNTDQFSTTGSAEAFDPSEPGWSMGCGGYARSWRANNPQVFPTQNLATVPVLLRVYAENNAALLATEVRLHTAIDTATTAAEKCSWVSLTIPAATGPQWFEAWGYVTVGLNPEQHVVGQLLVRQETSGTDLDVYAVQAYVWDGTHAPTA